MTRTGIYRIVHTASGRSYIGQTADFAPRWKRHLSDLRRGVHTSRRLQNAWTKHGEEAFEWEILEECKVEHLTEREQWHMDHYAPLTYNLTPAAGSVLGLRWTQSESAKAAISAWARKPRRPLSDEHKVLLSNANLGKGRPHTAETRAKISTWWTPENRAAHGEAVAGQLLGIKRSEAAKANMSVAQKKRWADYRAAKLLPALNSDAEQDKANTQSE